MKFTLISIAVLALLATTLPADDDSKKSTPVELGMVHWKRDLQAARGLSKASDRPILMLFQEVPGCATCQNYGKGPLSHPLMVEAIETLFVPVLVYNNKPGTDETLVKQFDEPAWNNPVVRYLDEDLKDVIARQDGIWSTERTAERMVKALSAAKKPVPEYLKLIAEDASGKTETAEFAMHCYWEGEAKLGSIAGVRNTRSGWRDQLEVVQVAFDPDRVDYSTLLSTAQSFACASKVYAHTKAQLDVAAKTVGDDTVNVIEDPEMREAKLSDQKYYVRNSVYGHLPLTSRQATRINAALHLKQPVKKWLSPQQLQVLQAIKLAESEDKDLFKDFVWPDDDAQLAAYQKRLYTELVRQSKLRQAR